MADDDDDVSFSFASAADVSFFFASFALVDVSFFASFAASALSCSCFLVSAFFASVAVASARAARRARQVDDLLNALTRLGWRESFVFDPTRWSLCAPGATPAWNASPPATIVADIAYDRAVPMSMDEVDACGESARQR